MNRFIRKGEEHLLQTFWFGIALSLWSSETFLALLFKPERCWNNIREFPGFFGYLVERWDFRTSRID
jgi:hypothetical protein